MKRQIKFRGKRVDNGEWVYGGIQIQHPHLQDHYIIDSDGYRQRVIPETVGQFTGLLAKDGREVYEDDVVETDGSMSFSNYDSGEGSRRLIYVQRTGFVGVRIGCEFDKDNPSSSHVWSNYQIWNIHRSLKVVGNVHDNPDIIK